MSVLTVREKKPIVNDDEGFYVLFYIIVNLSWFREGKFTVSDTFSKK